MPPPKQGKKMFVCCSGKGVIFYRETTPKIGYGMNERMNKERNRQYTSLLVTLIILTIYYIPAETSDCVPRCDDHEGAYENSAGATCNASTDLTFIHDCGDTWCVQMN